MTAVVMPFAVAAFVGGVLTSTHRTTVPPLTLPSVPVRPTSDPSDSLHPAQTAYSRACRGLFPKPFAGIAVNNDIGPHVNNFHQITGANVKVVEFYNPFPGRFQSEEATQALNLGALPLIQLNPRKITMTGVVSGRYDSYIKSYAEAVKAFGCYIILSFGHEMNGWWYPWGLPDTQPATFIQAWRHIHDIFTSLGVRNVYWSWDPSHQYAEYRAGKAASPASEWYPGDNYVDLVGLDGYLNPGQNFTEVFAHQLSSIRSVAGKKPIYLAETGVAPGVHELRQIDDLFAGLSQYHLAGLIWFDQNAKQPWKLARRPAADAEYRKKVAGFPK